MARIEHENNIYDEFITNVHTLIVTYFPSPWDKTFQ